MKYVRKQFKRNWKKRWTVSKYNKTRSFLVPHVTNGPKRPNKSLRLRQTQQWLLPPKQLKQHILANRGLYYAGTQPAVRYARGVTRRNIPYYHSLSSLCKGATRLSALWRTRVLHKYTMRSPLLHRKPLYTRRASSRTDTIPSLNRWKLQFSARRLTPYRRHITASVHTLRAGRLLQTTKRYRGQVHSQIATIRIRKRTWLKLRRRGSRINARALPGLRRRRRGKSGYAGLFNKTRWRAERRDKLLIRRAVYRLTKKANLKLRAKLLMLRLVSQKFTNLRHARVAARTSTPRISLRNFAHKYRALQLASSQKQWRRKRTRMNRSRLDRATFQNSRRILLSPHIARPVNYAQQTQIMPHLQLFHNPLQGGRPVVTRRLVRSAVEGRGPSFYALPLPPSHLDMLNSGRYEARLSRAAAQQILRDAVSYRAVRSSAPTSISKSVSRAIALRVPVTPSVGGVGASLRTFTPSFLAARCTPPAVTARVGTLPLSLLRQKYSARRLQEQRPKLRLPYTDVTRARRRHGGLGTFLNRPQRKPTTRVGKSNQLLSPLNVVHTLRSRPTLSRPVRAEGFIETTQLEDEQARFWRRPPARKNLRPLYYVHYSRFGRFKKYAALLQKRRRQQQYPTQGKRHFLPASYQQVGPGSAAYSTVRTKLNLYRSFLTRRTNLHNRVLRSTPSAPAVATSYFSARSNSPLSTWRTSLTHLQSAKAMQEVEFKLSAWSPQYQLRWRRRSHPRVNGVVLPRRDLSFKERRERNSQDATRAFHGLTQKLYGDLNYSRLQYHIGSVNSVGYARLRRVYRHASQNSRWWRPLHASVPFAHPFSRRALVAKSYRLQDLRANAMAGRTSPGIGAYRTTIQTIQLKNPARIIPWRNFRYKKPRHKPAPRTLQRWTFVEDEGKTRAPGFATLRASFVRTPRELRQNENVMPSVAVWQHRGWLAIDPKTALQAADSALSAFSTVPHHVWIAVRTHVGSLTKFAAVQKTLLADLRRWAARYLIKNVTTDPRTGAFVSVAGRYAASALQKLVFSRPLGLQAGFSASTQFSRAISVKRQSYLFSRELQQTDFTDSGEIKNLLLRENSPLLKRWLRGAEQLGHKTQKDYTPTFRSRYTANSAIDFGRLRTRFPAAGRRRQSYDSMLHAFSKRISPANFRRVAYNRFSRAIPGSTNDFRLRLLRTAVTANVRRRRILAIRLSGVSYMSPVWRELLSYRTNLDSTLNGPVTTAVHAVVSSSTQGQPLSAQLKRRFASLPVRVLFKHTRTLALTHSSPYKNQLRAIRAGVLRRALLRRRNERMFVDLRKSVTQRKLPREQPLRQGKRRKATKRRRSVRIGPWSAYALRTRSPKHALWTLGHLSANAPRIEDLQPRGLNPLLPSGEETYSAIPTATRNPRALRRFSAAPSWKPRCARKNRDSVWAHRNIIRRRPPLGFSGVMHQTYHWSEKKSFYRVAAVSASCAGFFTKKFARSARRLFKTVYRTALPRASTFSPVPPVRPSATSFSKEPLSCVGVAAISPYKQSYRLRCVRANFSSKMTKRRLKVFRRATKRALFRRNAVGFKQKPTLTNELVRRATMVSTALPLFFQRPSCVVVKTAVAKEQGVVAAIAAKEGRYKMTAQYAASLTAYIPELINFMFSKKIKENESPNFSVAKQLIKNVYWSLRVYLNVDPFDTRFFMRDKKPSSRLRILEEIEALSREQKTTQVERAALRYRFQPGQLLRSPSTKRFRGDWLRAFLPRKHALYQEDSEDYGMFLLQTRNIRRLRIGPKGIASWHTAPQPVAYESRARQLLTRRYSRVTPRFETLLQTSRRVAQQEAPIALAIDHVGRNFFFSRKFSTEATRGAPLVYSLLKKNTRFVSFTDQWRTISPHKLVTSRARVLSRIESRGRTGFVSPDGIFTGGTLLDSRFTRARSPRSRQYYLRMPTLFKGSSKAEKFSYITRFSRIRQKSRASLTDTLTAHQRRFVFNLPVRSTPTQHILTGARRRSTHRRSLLAALGPKSLLRKAHARTAAIVYRPHAVLRRTAITLHPHTRKIARRKKWKTFTLRPLISGMAATHAPTLDGNTRAMMTQNSTTRASGNQVFINTAGVGLAEQGHIAVDCKAVEVYNQQVPFEFHRSRLWNRLSLRWMKRHRIARYWLKNTSRWLRDPWLSQIVSCTKIKGDRYAGELRAREQQIGEYVAEVDDSGKDIPESQATYRERHEFKPRKVVLDPEIARTKKALESGPMPSITKHRLMITRMARRKPIPAMWLANYEYQDVIREHKEEKEKTKKQKEEEEAARVKAFWLRKARGEPEEKSRRLPLKSPADLWLPPVIWKEIQRRVRKFEWRESDEVFFRKGFRNAFSFYPSEKNRAPWLEALMYTRATYSTRLREFRRRQFPREQKKYKWLQRVRKSLFYTRTNRYIRYRKWRQLRRYNQKLHYSLFDFPSRRAASRHFQRLNRRTRPDVSSFASSTRGLADRLDNFVLQLGIVPSIYWSRIVVPFGFVSVNGVTISTIDHALQPGDLIHINWDLVARFQHFFRPVLRFREEYQRKNRQSTPPYTANLEYHRGTRTIVYNRPVDEADLRKSSRLQPSYFRWFRLDTM